LIVSNGGFPVDVNASVLEFLGQIHGVRVNDFTEQQFSANADQFSDPNGWMARLLAWECWIWGRRDIFCFQRNHSSRSYHIETGIGRTAH
jgi:hypothetical protein